MGELAQCQRLGEAHSLVSKTCSSEQEQQLPTNEPTFSRTSSLIAMLAIGTVAVCIVSAPRTATAARSLSLVGFNLVWKLHDDSAGISGGEHVGKDFFHSCHLVTGRSGAMRQSYKKMNSHYSAVPSEEASSSQFSKARRYCYSPLLRHGQPAGHLPEAKPILFLEENKPGDRVLGLLWGLAGQALGTTPRQLNGGFQELPKQSSAWGLRLYAGEGPQRCWVVGGDSSRARNWKDREYAQMGLHKESVWHHRLPASADIHSFSSHLHRSTGPKFCPGQRGVPDHVCYPSSCWYISSKRFPACHLFAVTRGKLFGYTEIIERCLKAPLDLMQQSALDFVLFLPQACYHCTSTRPGIPSTWQF